MFSSRRNTKLACLLGIAFLATAAGAAYFAMAPLTVQGSASSAKMKMLNRGPAGAGWVRLHGKGTTVLDVRITAVNLGVPAAGSSIELEATIRARNEITDVEYSWDLPEGVALATGSSQGHLGTLRAGETQTLRLSAIAQTNENRLVHLHVFRRGATEAVGTVAQHNTVDQARVERKVEIRAQSMKLLTEDGEPLRVMQ